MHEVALDTVSLQHAIRCPKKQRAKTTPLPSKLDVNICNGKVRIVIDGGGALLQEYRETCGEEIVGALAAKWESCNGITVIKKPPKIPNNVKRRLYKLDFVDTIDKLVLALALKAHNRIAVSDDGDFWDPKNDSLKGNERACIAQLCRTELGITVMLLGRLLARVERV